MEVVDRTESLDTSDELRAQVKDVFIEYEKVFGFIEALKVNYDVWKEEFCKLEVEIKQEGRLEFKPISSLITPFNTGAASAATQSLIKLINEGLAEFPVNENSKGSQGDISMVRSARSLEVCWEHTDLYTTEEIDDVSLNEATWEDLVPLVQAVGAREMIITYEGSGDSMDGQTISFKDTRDTNLIVDVTSGEVKAILEVFDQLMCGPVNGFCDNDGGHGEICINTADIDLSYWNHWYYDNDNSDEYEETFKVPMPVREQVGKVTLIQGNNNPVWQ